MIDVVGCAICHESFDEKMPSVVTRCGHVFDERCLNEWLIRNPNCPTCRSACEQHCLTKVHFSVVPIMATEFKDDVEILRQQLEEANLKQTITESLKEQLKKDLQTRLDESEMKVAMRDSLIDEMKKNVEDLESGRAFLHKQVISMEETLELLLKQQKEDKENQNIREPQAIAGVLPQMNALVLKKPTNAQKEEQKI